LPQFLEGIFLSFLPNADKNVLWYDPETDRVKIAKHAHFNEGMNDLLLDEIPHNVVHLQCVQNGEPLPAEVEESIVKEFTFTANLLLSPRPFQRHVKTAPLVSP